jgi:TatA/E family protein of Tat protein translocase
VTLLFLESLGTTELLMILVVALVVFGPRRLPEIGRKIGKGMADFRRASDDFKRTWEREVEAERTTVRTMLAEPNSAAAVAAIDAAPAPRYEEEASAAGPFVYESENSVARGSRGGPPYEEVDAPAPAAAPQPAAAAAADSAAPRQEQLGKADWL